MTDNKFVLLIYEFLQKRKTMKRLLRMIMSERETSYKQIYKTSNSQVLGELKFYKL